MQIGDKGRWERTFTNEDVLLFAQISGDQGIHHLEADEQGRLMVHGLLTATLPTKLGGDLNYIARELHFEFLRPVYTSDTVSCETTITALKRVEGRGYTEMSVTFTCHNQRGKEVLRGTTSGIVRD